ncbi:S9 family peptidase [Oceanithermus sp.]|uniref:S9 family peptidase n=1 Tax=Oceanithermus sp. TaxID=2268145 RepID=UPI0025F88574|nr:S9 family peptidase [Oceanithermus sp.]
MSVKKIPLEVLFGDPELGQVRVAPDGRSVAFIAPWEGVKNLWVMDLASGERRRVTSDRGRGVQGHGWLPSGLLIYAQDKDGDENWRLYAVDPAGGEPRLLTPGEGVQAQLLAVHPDYPDELLVLLNDRDPALHDVWRINARTGERRRALENPGFIGFLADERLNVRLAHKSSDDGGGELYLREGDAWKPLLRWGLDDSLGTWPLALRGNTLYMASSLGRDTAALVAVDLATGEERLLAEDPRYDLPNEEGLLFHPRAARPEAVAVMRDRLGWIVLDPALEPDFERLAELDGDVYVTSRDQANRVWVVREELDAQSPRYWVYDRSTRELTLLGDAHPALADYTLAPMQPVRYRARDGLEIEAYLTLPPGREPRGLPTVIFPHGGPWYRDVWGFDPIAQWLANRGFAVLQPNFRGSTGYGKTLLNAGNKEWGRKMQDDLTDGVRWLVEQGIADPERVAIMGGSYGGYATLAGLAFTPELYAAGVDIVGPSNLFTLLETVPPYWKPMIALFHTRMGHPERDAELLRAASPLFSAEKIQAPLLIGQGANDPRVKRAESLQIVQALKEKGKPVEYVEYPDEGHGFVKAENRLDFFRKAEAFLEKHLNP